MLKKEKSIKKCPYSRITKKVLGWLHLWLGLISGIVVVISMLAASVFTWEEELTNWWYADLVYHNQPASSYLSASALLEAVEKAYPAYKTNRLVVRSDINKNWTFRFRKRAENQGWTYASTMEYDLLVFVNPFTGQVIGHIDKERDWISLAAVLHMSLLLNHAIGSQIVGASALIMIILALTGLYLWWPKNRLAARQRFWFRWKASTGDKRKNYDIHNISGFYFFLPLFLMGLTGTGFYFGDELQWVINQVTFSQPSKKAEVVQDRSSYKRADF